MEHTYQLVIRNLNDNLDIKQYKELLQKEWNNNIYYSYEYLTYFTNPKASDTLKYFLFKNLEDCIVVMPFIHREIKMDGNEATYYDIMSPYGYNGPLYNDDVSEEDIKLFWQYVDKWYEENNVITEFVRFSLNGNHVRYSGVLSPALKNVKGDILEADEQWSKFKPKVRNNYRKSIQKNLKLQMYYNPVPEEVIRDFYDIYNETMGRKKAHSQFFHYIDYFKNLIEENQSNLLIAVVYLDSKAISTELIFIVGDTLYSCLGGTLSDYFFTRPNDFLKIEVMNWARENDFKYYILGGGREDGDSLYKYKKSFFPQDEDLIFYTGRKIINKKIYDDLCVASSEEYTDAHKESFENYFFPFYRLNDQ